MLEATMKQRFPWMVLLIMSGLIGPSFCGISEDKKTCDSDGIVGTFSVDQKLNSLTITPANFTTNLEVQINTTTVGGASSDQGIQLYLTLDAESECEKVDFTFQIVSEGGKSCDFEFNWTIKPSLSLKIQKKVFDGLPAAYNDPHIASFEVRKESNKFQQIVTDISGNSLETADANECIDIGGTSIQFKLKVPKPAEDAAKVECGVQLEMKGEYAATSLRIGEMECELEQAGTSNGDNSMPITTTTKQENEDEETFPMWAIIVIAVVVALLIIGVAVFLIVYYVILPKRKAASGDDVEDVADAPEGETGSPDDLVQTAEEIQD